MAATTGLKDSLQEISALMGLLRSDLRELAQAPIGASRGPVVDHIRWIAERFDQLGPSLSAEEPAAQSASEVTEATPEPAAEAVVLETAALTEPEATPQAPDVETTPEGEPSATDEPKHRGRRHGHAEP
jgi:hypothetical protein